MDSDKKRGIYNKYSVVRMDHRDRHGDKHHGCRYFVLDLDHDPFAIDAIREYARRCYHIYPVLAQELFDLSDSFSTKRKADTG